MGFSADDFGQALERILPAEATGVVAGVSGGLDSCCLAAALAALPPGLPRRALHVDHGLQDAAAAFRTQTLALCRRLGLDLTIVAVPVDVSSGTSIEAAAREARYRAIAAQLAPGECLLTAHTRDDQAETFLLQALRGAGPKGLAGMPARRELGAGWHLRPLLLVTRQELRQFAAGSRITPVEDPMNTDLRFDRAFLRHDIWPKLVERWPGAATALSRAAGHCAEAQKLLDGLADRDLAAVRDGEALSVRALRCLPDARRLNAVRRWINDAAVVPPSAARLTEALRQVLDARDDHLPGVAWAGHALRRYRDRVFMTAAEPPRLRGSLVWNWRTERLVELGAGLGRLRAIERPGGLALGDPDRPLIVHARAGGERLRVAASGRAQSVQHLCQSRGILPWVRDALPFIYDGDELVAIADLWSSASRSAAAGAPGIGFRWEDAPMVC